MKTLDEVIEALEKCTDYDAECEGCPYQEDNEGGLECEMRNLDEVLHYLKEYRAGKDDLERTKKMCFEFVGTKMIEAEKQGRALVCPNCGDEFIILPERNDPLTWSELKKMAGKPVWVEVENNDPVWAIPMGITTLGDNERMCMVGAEGGHAIQVEVAKDSVNGWQAYRKERE